MTIITGLIQPLITDTIANIIGDGDGLPFISQWTTTNTGTSNNDQISLPLEASGTYNFLVDWGDGNSDTITVWNQAETTHTYSVSGTYTVTITGTIDGWRFNAAADEDKLILVSQWGILLLGNNGEYFFGCDNLVITATDILDTSAITDMSQAFSSCDSLTTVPNMDQWDVSNVTDFSQMFRGAALFNQPIDAWDVSSATDINAIFRDATVFNQPLNSWDVSSVISMSCVFNGASAFNQDISSWVVSAVTDMERMFINAIVFNQDIGSWIVSAVLDMSSMFNGASAFDQDIGSWTVSAVTDMRLMFNSALVFNQDITSWTVSAVLNMSSMFNGALAFNQLIGVWNVSAVTNMASMFNGAIAFNSTIDAWTVSAVTDMSSMFSGATVFNQSLNSWNVSAVTLMNSMFLNAVAFNGNITSWTVSAVTNMSSMFDTATVFNQNIGSWVVSAVISMSAMFQDAIAFNQDLDSWVVSAVTSMNSMFNGAVAFNQPVNSWTVTAVTDMISMFNGATVFNQDVSGWVITAVTDMTTMFLNSAFARTNYDLLLVAWEGLAVQNNVVFHAGTAMYGSGAPATARAALIADHTWSITDGGEAAFLPTDIADLEFWLDADDASTITESSDFVSQWDDKSGNGFDVTQGTGSAQPMTNQNTLNSLNVITTDGNDTMLIPSGLNFVGAGPNTRFALCRRASEDATNDNIASVTQGGPARISLQYSSTSGRIAFVHNVSNNLIFSNGNTNTNFQVIMGRRSGTTQALAVDGGTEVTDTNASDVTGITDRDLFALNQITSFLTGDIAEFLVYSRSLSSGEITDVIDYFTAKWGIP